MRPLLIAAALLGLTGCANELLSNDRIADETSGLLGHPVTISDRQYSGGVNTYYTATTDRGRRYRCTINGGTVLALGMTNAPSCERD